MQSKCDLKEKVVLNLDGISILQSENSCSLLIRMRVYKGKAKPNFIIIIIITVIWVVLTKTKNNFRFALAKT